VVDAIQVGPGESPKPKPVQGPSRGEQVQYEENAGVLTKSGINDSFRMSACANVQMSKFVTRTCGFLPKLYVAVSWHHRSVSRVLIKGIVACRTQTNKCGLAEERSLPPRLCRCRKVTKATNGTAMMQSIQPGRVGACSDSRPSRFRNPYGYNPGTEERWWEQRPRVSLACVTPGCCKPLRYWEIRNRV